jgi:hypothetical protein
MVLMVRAVRELAFKRAALHLSAMLLEVALRDGADHARHLARGCTGPRSAS